jgi:hypothetical protein
MVMKEESGFGGGSNGSQFIGPNPTRSGKIVYYLKKRHTFGKMSIEIQDMLGNKVASVDAKKQRGINIVTWGFHIKSPVVAKGKTFSFGGFASPRVPAGNYVVVMKKGKEEYRHEIELQYDPKSDIPLADRKAQEDMAMLLYDMTQDLAYLVYRVDAAIDYITTTNADNHKLNKAAGESLTLLNNLKETLVVTTGDNYVGAAEDQLREDIGDLYSVITGNFEKPGNSQYNNLTTLEKRLEAAHINYDAIKKEQWAKYQKTALKHDLKPLEVKSFDDFINN